MALALEGRAMKDDILIGDTPKAVKRRRRLRDVQSSGRLWKHSRLADIYGLVVQAEIENYFTFTLVRNPWDMLVSYYHWLLEQNFEHPAVRLAKANDFSGFINTDHTKRTMRGSPYSHYMKDRDGVLQCDLFIRLEHLSRDILKLEDHLGFSLGQIAPVNASKRESDYRSYYNTIDTELVADICAQDIKQFNYEF